MHKGSSLRKLYTIHNADLGEVYGPIRFVSKSTSFFGNVHCLSNFREFTPALRGGTKTRTRSTVEVSLLSYTYHAVDNVHVYENL